MQSSLRNLLLSTYCNSLWWTQECQQMTIIIIIIIIITVIIIIIIIIIITVIIIIIIIIIIVIFIIGIIRFAEMLADWGCTTIWEGQCPFSFHYWSRKY